MEIAEKFTNLMAQKSKPHVLALGARRVHPDKSTLCKDWIPHAEKFIGTDFQPGIDVDVLADAHFLSDVFGENKFDAVIAMAVYEHIQYPWLAAIEICKVLKPGGLVYVQTVQSFPLHSFPYDYWRFSADGLKTLFSEQAGFRTIEATHDLPCKVISEDVPETEEHPAYIYATILAQKMSHPETDFRYSAQKISLETGGGVTSEGEELNQKTISSEIATGVTKSALEDKRIQLSLINTASYKRLKHHWFFGLFIRLCDHLVNYPAEAKMFSKLGLVELNKRYERSVSHWLFGPVIRWGNAAGGKSPAPKKNGWKREGMKE